MHGDTEIGVTFPDLEEAQAHGNAMSNATEILAHAISSRLDRGQNIPTPSCQSGPFFVAVTIS